MYLSILILTTYDRLNFLNQMMSYLSVQNKSLLQRTEILINCDAKVKSIGQKRNESLQSATGKYVVFIDDDDYITPNYLDEIFKGIDLGVQHIGIYGTYIPDNNHCKAAGFKCSMNYLWDFDPVNNVYLRGPQHICVIKSEIAISVKYPEISFGEDREYSIQITPLISSEYLIDKPIYIYKYRSNK